MKFRVGMPRKGFGRLCAVAGCTTFNRGQHAPDKIVLCAAHKKRAHEGAPLIVFHGSYVLPLDKNLDKIA